MNQPTTTSGFLGGLARRLVADGLLSESAARELQTKAVKEQRPFVAVVVESTRVAAHELAHVRRHDYLVNLLQGMAEALASGDGDLALDAIQEDIAAGGDGRLERRAGRQAHDGQMDVDQRLDRRLDAQPFARDRLDRDSILGDEGRDVREAQPGQVGVDPEPRRQPGRCHPFASPSRKSRPISE